MRADRVPAFVNFGLVWTPACVDLGLCELPTCVNRRVAAAGGMSRQQGVFQCKEERENTFSMTTPATIIPIPISAGISRFCLNTR
jgi:hypothetical protein